MRYREIREAGDKIDAIAAKIKQDCQPFLKEISPHPLNYQMYRGIKNAGDSKFITKDVRLSGRKPSDMPVFLHNKINDYFNSQFGEPFRDSLFVSGSTTVAQSYTIGSETERHNHGVFLVFPIGNFSFIWSPETEDLFSVADEFMYPHDESSPFMKDFEEEVLSTYINTDLKRAITSGHELMIRCNSYHAVHHSLYNDLLAVLQ